MTKFWSILFFVFITYQFVFAPPVEKEKKPDPKANKTEEIDEYGLEYGRYLHQVVQALEQDKEFAKKLENITAEQIREGHLAKELEFVKHNIRSKLDELKRIEIDRIRKLIQEKMERSELGLYRDGEGHLLNSPDGRRWRTIQNTKGGFEGLNRKGIKIPQHLDVNNPHTFEVDDLKKLIQTATRDLEELDRQRREDFKKYELEKEAKYRESLKNMTEEQRKEMEKHHKEQLEKNKNHPKIHHPGSKSQLEDVWAEQDHMPKDEFNPNTFFAMHDLNGDGFLDVEEVEAILILEVQKLYANRSEEDPVEMEEEFHRMREHVFTEVDQNHDGLISREEFLQMTAQKEFQQDEGWKSLDEQTVYSEAELEEYMRQRQMEMQHHQQMNVQHRDDQRLYYNVPNAQGNVPPQINSHMDGMSPQPGYHQPVYGQPPQYQVPPHPQQFQGAHPSNFQGQNQQGVVPPQQQFHPNQQHFQPNQHQQQFQPNQHQQQFQPNQQHQQQFQPNQQHQQQFQPNQQHQQQFQPNQHQQQFQPNQHQQQFQPNQHQQQFQPNQPQQMPQVPHYQPNIPPQYQAGQPQFQGNQQAVPVPQQAPHHAEKSDDKAPQKPSDSINQIKKEDIKSTTSKSPQSGVHQ